MTKKVTFREEIRNDKVQLMCFKYVFCASKLVDG